MIVSAAVKMVLDDFCGTEVCIPVHRHKDGKIIGKKLLGYEPFIKEEGFFTDTGEFLTRKDAVGHAYGYGQLDGLSEDKIWSIYMSGQLMSEDLW